MRIALCLAAILVSFLEPRLSAAQVLTGSLTGTVRDEQGLVVAGVQVRLTSPSIIGGALTGTTDTKGQVRFSLLTPGVYAIELTMRGFDSARSAGIHITTGSAIVVDLLLAVRRQAEDVRVVARNTTDPGVGALFGASQLLDAPTPRNGPFASIVMSPFTSQTTRTTSFVSVGGGGIDQNLCFADGTNITATSNGVCRSEPGSDFIEEIRVQLVGVSAEYGGAQGGVIEIITRQGSDRFLSSGSFYGQPRGLTSQPVLRPINGIGTLMSGYERRRYANVTTTLGGPIVRGRAWFFGGYEYLHDEDTQPGGDPAYPKKSRQKKSFGKLTWRLAPGWQLMQSVHYESWDNLELPTATKLVEATQRLKATVPAVTLGNLTHAAGPNRVWEMSAGRFSFVQYATRSTGDPDAAGHEDLKTGVQSGAPRQLGRPQQIRWTARMAVSQYQAGLLGTDHQWKVGGQFDRGEHRAVTFVPTGVRYTANPSRAIYSNPSNQGGRFVTASAFVTDTFHIGGRVSVSAGVRFDHLRAMSQDIRQVDEDFRETGVTITGAGFLYAWNVVSPRIGVAAKLTSDGRTMVRASYGLFSPGILTGELSSAHPGGTTNTTYDYDPATGNLTNPVVQDPRQNLWVDRGTRAPRTETYSISLDREIAGPLTAGVAYMHKTGRDFIGWKDTGATYSPGSTIVDGVTIPLHVLATDPSTRRFTLGNQPNYSLNYNGVSVMVEKRQSHGWYTIASYTFSRASGLQPSSGTSAAGAQVATVGAPPVSFAPAVTFGRDPNTLTNADGRLPNDRPHLLRVMSSFNVPRVGIGVGVNFQHSSGKPWAKTVDLTPQPKQGTVHILLEPRGTRRLSSQTVVDLRVSKSLLVGDAGRVELRFDVLNLLNDTAEESIGSDRFDAAVVGNVFLDPRRVMLSVKLNLGK